MATPNPAPTPPAPAPALLTVAQFAAAQPGLSEAGVRWHVFNERFNGLADSGAIIRAGRRVLIDPALYLAWLRTNPTLSPSTKPGHTRSKPAAPLGGASRRPARSAA